jgi:predicted regulator of Ras-like GTPase activity (Roadblock/LC7/MglB family)
MSNRIQPTAPTSGPGDIARELRRNNAEVIGAFVIDGDGRVLAADAVTPDVSAAAVALVVPARELLDRVAAELGCGAVRTFFLEGDRASIAFADVDGSSTAVVLGQTSAAPGALRADALELAHRAAGERRLS